MGVYQPVRLPVHNTQGTAGMPGDHSYVFLFDGNDDIGQLVARSLDVSESAGPLATAWGAVRQAARWDYDRSPSDRDGPACEAQAVLTLASSIPQTLCSSLAIRVLLMTAGPNVNGEGHRFRGDVFC